jgi:hypothetical protein
MELLIRWRCPRCRTAGAQCPECHGLGHVEQWIPIAMLNSLQPTHWIIMARRHFDPDRE